MLNLTQPISLTRHIVIASYLIAGRVKDATLIINETTCDTAMKCAERWVEERTHHPIVSITVDPKGPAVMPESRERGVVYVCFGA